MYVLEAEGDLCSQYRCLFRVDVSVVLCPHIEQGYNRLAVSSNGSGGRVKLSLITLNKLIYFCFSSVDQYRPILTHIGEEKIVEIDSINQVLKYPN